MNNNEKLERFALTHGCPACVKEEAKVTVPCAVRAFAEVKEVEIKCKGEPCVVCGSQEAPGCSNAVSKFTVSQRIVVTIPLVFRAEADVGEGHVEFSLCPEDCPCKDKEPERPCKEKEPECQCREEESKNQMTRRRV